MAAMRINVHRQSSPKDSALKFLQDRLSAKQRVFWDKQGHGISLCSGRDWEQEAGRHPERYVELKTEDDVEETMRHYEDGE